jgi:hypothetical protein
MLLGNLKRTIEKQSRLIAESAPRLAFRLCSVLFAPIPNVRASDFSDIARVRHSCRIALDMRQVQAVVRSTVRRIYPWFRLPAAYIVITILVFLACLSRYSSHQK